MALETGATTKFLPYAYIDGNRRTMLPELQQLGILIEALKLWRYQRKGHIATVQQAMDYYALGSEFMTPAQVY